MKSIAKTERNLNDYYSDCLSLEQAIDSLIYLTNKNRPHKHTTVRNLTKHYYNRTLGTLLKKLDTISFNVSRVYD